MLRFLVLKKLNTTGRYASIEIDLIVHDYKQLTHPVRLNKLFIFAAAFCLRTYAMLFCRLAH